MNRTGEVKTIDPRGLEHHEKEELIFPSIEELLKGESLKIVMEFNPLPLIYLLKTHGEFELSYEKEGPEEWILVVKRTAVDKNKREKLKEMVQNLKTGIMSEATKNQVKRLFQAADVKGMKDMEQDMKKQGFLHDAIRKNLCDIHLEVLREKLVDQQIEVEAPHPVNSFMEEHKIILQTLNDLGSILEKLKKSNNFKDFNPDLEKLRECSHHLVEAESHHQREEEALFPKLEAHDITEPAGIMKLDHLEFRQRKQALYQLSHNPEDYQFDLFKKRCIELGEYLMEELENHIFKEDNIIYQIALQTLSEKEWQVVKRDCDKIGYCCFTPRDRTEKAN